MREVQIIEVTKKEKLKFSPYSLLISLASLAVAFGVFLLRRRPRLPKFGLAK